MRWKRRTRTFVSRSKKKSRNAGLITKPCGKASSGELFLNFAACKLRNRRRAAELQTNSALRQGRGYPHELRHRLRPRRSVNLFMPSRPCDFFPRLVTRCGCGLRRLQDLRAPMAERISTPCKDVVASPLELLPARPEKHRGGAGIHRHCLQILDPRS